MYGHLKYVRRGGNSEDEYNIDAPPLSRYRPNARAMISLHDALEGMTGHTDVLLGYGSSVPRLLAPKHIFLRSVGTVCLDAHLLYEICIQKALMKFSAHHAIDGCSHSQKSKTPRYTFLLLYLLPPPFSFVFDYICCNPCF